MSNNKGPERVSPVFLVMGAAALVFGACSVTGLKPEQAAVGLPVLGLLGVALVAAIRGNRH